MARWTTGKSGNPAGRKPRTRDFTTFLEEAGKVKTTWLGKDKRRYEVIAEIVWQGLMSGEITLPNSKKVIVLSLTDWKDLAKWLYTQVDGPPRQEVDLTTNDKPDTQLTEEERVNRVIALFEKARERAIQQPNLSDDCIHGDQK
jgi:hypothetical protein